MTPGRDRLKAVTVGKNAFTILRVHYKRKTACPYTRHEDV